MKKTDTVFLEIIKNAIHNTKYEEKEALSKEEWQYVVSLAEMHSLLPLLYEAVYDAPSFRSLESAYVFSLKRKVMAEVFSQTVRTEEFIKLYKKLGKKGVRPL